MFLKRIPTSFLSFNIDLDDIAVLSILSCGEKDNGGERNQT